MIRPKIIGISEMEWQPIEIAPRDGSLILAWNKIGGMYVVGWQPAYGPTPLDEDHWDNVGSKNSHPSLHFNQYFFSHWMPLPFPPSA